MKNKIILMLTVPIMAVLGLQALAVDPDYSFREGVRSQVQSNLYSDAVNMPGTLSVTSNVGVGGALLVTGNQTNTGSIQANGGIVIPATAGAVASLSCLGLDPRARECRRRCSPLHSPLRRTPHAVS